MLNTKQIDITEAHVEKKNHLKINRPGDRNYSAEADSGLSKQLLGNFQTEHSCHRNYSRLIKKIRSSRPEVFLKTLQNSQENTIPRQAPPATLLKKRLLHRCFPVNFANFLRTRFLQNTSGRLLLKNGVACKKNIYYNDRINKVYLLAPGWNYNRNYFLKSSIIKHVHIF